MPRKSPSASRSKTIRANRRSASHWDCPPRPAGGGNAPQSRPRGQPPRGSRSHKWSARRRKSRSTCRATVEASCGNSAISANMMACFLTPSLPARRGAALRPARPCSRPPASAGRASEPHHPAHHHDRHRAPQADKIQDAGGVFPRLGVVVATKSNTMSTGEPIFSADASTSPSRRSRGG